MAVEVAWKHSAWMGLEYTGRGADSGRGEGRWPLWWGEGAQVVAPETSNGAYRMVGTLGDGRPWPVVSGDFGTVIKHVRDGGWCWKIRFGHGVDVVDPSRRIVRQVVQIAPAPAPK